MTLLALDALLLNTHLKEPYNGSCHGDFAAVMSVSADRKRSLGSIGPPLVDIVPSSDAGRSDPPREVEKLIWMATRQG